ncbi:hypothetical protein GCM10023116_10690 [Kistimonas scapharcae]|uniref:Uncharacterized protein n=1 Tax=Kistimonas scapharcae TaxID=1036133 RepID=A0ABP8UZ29_9GAMM
MGAANIWLRFKALLPSGNRTIVTIIANNGNGTSQAQLRDGSIVVVEGEIVSGGSRALVVDRKVIGMAPELLQYEMDV